jgi:peptidoglycan/LPS O-acetylase OafA/YrhL
MSPAKASTRPKGALKTGAEPAPKRWTGLEGYRGLLAIAIVFFHANQHSRDETGRYAFVFGDGWPNTILNNLDMAVAAFFVLSGFLVSRSLLAAAVAGDAGPGVRMFLRRRVARIAPQYWIAIIIVWFSRYNGQPEQWLSLAEHLSFTQVFDTRHIYWDIGPAWFLADAMLMYVATGLLGSALVRVCRRIPRRGMRIGLLGGVIFLLIGASVAYKWIAAYGLSLPATNYAAYYGPLAKLDLFAIGMLLALIELTGGLAPLVRSAGRRMTAVLLGALVIAESVRLRRTTELGDLFFFTQCALGFALITAVLVTSQSKGLISRVLSSRVLQWIGLVSFSLFLWHEPVMLWLSNDLHLLSFNTTSTFVLNATVLLIVSLAVASVSRTVIDPPKRTSVEEA